MRLLLTVRWRDLAEVLCKLLSRVPAASGKGAVQGAVQAGVAAQWSGLSAVLAKMLCRVLCKPVGEV